jgi:hypothetical protein
MVVRMTTVKNKPLIYILNAITFNVYIFHFQLFTSEAFEWSSSLISYEILFHYDFHINVIHFSVLTFSEE